MSILYISVKTMFLACIQIYWHLSFVKENICFWKNVNMGGKCFHKDRNIWQFWQFLQDSFCLKMSQSFFLFVCFWVFCFVLFFFANDFNFSNNLNLQWSLSCVTTETRSRDGGERGERKKKKALRLNNKERKNMEMRWYNHNVDLHSQ